MSNDLAGRGREGIIRTRNVYNNAVSGGGATTHRAIMRGINRGYIPRLRCQGYLSGQAEAELSHRMASAIMNTVLTVDKAQPLLYRWQNEEQPFKGWRQGWIGVGLE